jgi:hypothetical protein
VSAPLPTACLEVLRALAIGLVLEETAGGWSFRSAWQACENSSVSCEAMVALFGRGFVLREGNRATITDQGRKYLCSRLGELAARAHLWLRSPASQSETY